jgi:shikimate dehydrogenase
MNAAPQRIGLIGEPVEHSLSPAFQQPAFDALELSITYELWPTKRDDVAARLDDIRQGRALGANVTVPHKELAYSLMDEVSATARRAGAVNTVSVRDGQFIGDNTDVYGFSVPLYDRDFAFASTSAVILGAGGAARAVAVALLDAGIRSLSIVNRTPDRAAEIAAAIQDDRVKAHGLDALYDQVGGVSLLVNATSLGWTGTESPVTPEAFARLADNAVAYDLTYRETPFLHAARTAGLAVIDGLAMLVHQGAKSFEIWTGRPAPVGLMWEHAVAVRAKRSE